MENIPVCPLPYNTVLLGRDYIFILLEKYTCITPGA